jgi:hypothetical protein
MKRLAGHDFEDILQASWLLGYPQMLADFLFRQCIIPCLEGLLPEPHNSTVLDLIFLLATWHALAKLNLHTNTSLHLLDTTTTALGAGLRYFVGVTCSNFNTFETTTEYSKRRRNQTAKGSQGPPESADRQPKTLSLKTIKLHFLGDYAECIKSFGVTNNYTSGIVRPPHSKYISQ